MPRRNIYQVTCTARVTFLLYSTTKEKAEVEIAGWAGAHIDDIAQVYNTRDIDVVLVPRRKRNAYGL